jgi:hypothetical protein
MFRLLAHVPVQSIATDMSASPITQAGWTQLVASTLKAGCAIEISNNSGATIQLSLGSAGQESTAIIPYTVLPGGSAILLPMEIPRLSRISAKAVDQPANTGFFTINLFG